jgi:hypothetical protein
MARIVSKNFLNGASGRIGNTVTYVLNGVQVIRSLPYQGKKHKPSALQQQHLDAFKKQHLFARSVKQTVIDRIWSKEEIPPGLNPYNYFLKCNRAAFANTEKIMHPALLRLSTGKLLLAENMIFACEGHLLQIKWDNSQINFYARTTDRLNVVLLLNRESILFLDAKAVRADGDATIQLPDTVANDMVEGFLFWSDVNDNAFSPSVFWQVKE